MKKILILVLTIGMSLSLFAKQYPLKVDQAYLYFNGGELTQTVEIPVIKGTHEYVLTNVTVGAERKTIRLFSGSDVIKIIGFNYIEYFDYSSGISQQIELYKDSIESYKTLVRNDALNIKISNEEIALLKSGMEELMANEKVNYSTSQLSQLLKYYHSENRTKAEELYAYTKSLENSNTKLKRLKKQLKKIDNKSYKSGAIKVKISAFKKAKITLSMKSFTHYVSWNPKYEATVSTIDKTLALDFNAQINQDSKLDWNQVKMMLFSNSVSFNNELPELQSYWLQYETKIYGAKQRVYEDENRMLETVTVSTYEPKVNQKQTGNEYDLPNTYSINATNSYSNLISVASYTLPINIEMRSIPSYDKFVYMQAELLDYRELQLLDGSMNLTCDGVYLGTTYFVVGTENEKVELTLGRNSHILVSRNLVNQSNRETTFGGKKIRKEAYKTILKNTSSIKQVVYVKDRYPVPVDKSIEVELLESTTQFLSIDEVRGFITWKVELEPYSTQSLYFEYQVKYSKDKKLSL